MGGEDLELARRVAVKTLAPSADRQRFEREARAVAALSHANIVALYDYGESEGRPFMVLECLQGGSLEDRLASGRPLPDAETRRIAADVAAGLAHAHERGLVHRDLKPANILFDAEGRAKIADFGIARMRGTGTLTETGTVLGTASYLSPEQATGETAGPASDVYSFGVILFRLLTGRLPFAARTRWSSCGCTATTHRRPSATCAPTRRATSQRSPMRRSRRTRSAAGRRRRTASPRCAASELEHGHADHRRLCLAAAAAGSRSQPRAVASALLVAGVALALALTHGGGNAGTQHGADPQPPDGDDRLSTTTSAPSTTDGAADHVRDRRPRRRRLRRRPRSRPRRPPR